MSHLKRGLNTIHVIGVGPTDALGQVLREAFDNVLFPDKTLPSAQAELAVGICARCDDDRLQSFVEWAHGAKVAALCVDVRDTEALIGPITLADRAGCGRCAVERITAASATSQPANEEQPLFSLDEASNRIAPVLVREIQAIESDGVEQSELIDHVLVVNLATRDESLHKVIPLHSCAICGGASAFPQTKRDDVRLTPDDSPEVVLGALAGWVDQRTGVISELFIEPPDDLQLALPIIATAAPPHLIEKDGSLRRLPLGWGKGLTISGAVLSAVGEAIERYSASLIDPGRIVWKRPDELDAEWLDPRECGLYSDEQYEREGFPYVRFDESIPHPWVLGHWCESGQPVWLPAIDVFLSLEIVQEQSIAQGTSNGLAASTSKDDAALRAILELVERDAFMTAWLTGAAGKRIDLDDALDPLLRLVLHGIESLGATVEVYTLPSVIGTTVLCLALGDGEKYPGVTFGLGSDLQPQVALRQAMLELGQTGPYLRRMMQTKTLIAATEPESVREMLDHAAYYFPKERASAFDRLRSQNRGVSLSELGEVSSRSFADCVSALRAVGLRMALVDVTSADVATGPFTVMRAVSPDLQTIWYGYGLERTPVRRISKVDPHTPTINPIW